jgi:hypothetical protein
MSAFVSVVTLKMFSRKKTFKNVCSSIAKPNNKLGGSGAL